MTTSKVLSASGAIHKKEYVRNTRIKSLKRYLIFESTDPFPDAHFRHKSSLVQFYYVAIDAVALDPDIKIAAQSAEGQMGDEVASALGEIEVGSKTYYTIRLRNIPTQMLPRLIKAYEYEGIKMHLFEKEVHDFAWIRVSKFFHLEEIDEGVYMDLDHSQIGYVESPRKLEWKELEELTQKVKKDVAHSNFDKALGSISKKGEPTEIIRIYAPNMTEEVMMDISRSYRTHYDEL